jgi:hypothetical protein
VASYGFVNFPLPSLAEEPPSTHLSFNGHRGASAKDGAGAFIGDGGSISFGQSSGRVKKGVSHECAKHIEGAAALLDVGAGVSIDTGGDPADGSIGGFPGPRIKYTGGLGVIGAIGQSNTTIYAPW